MNLIWFRCDLRTTDNSALLAAADGRPCVALYLLSPAQWREHDDAPCKVDFWLRNLGELQRQLAALNIPLLVRDCGHWRQAPEVIGRLCRELGIGAVHVNQEYGVNEERRDQAVGQRLREQGVAFHSHLDQLFFAPGSVLTRTGGYFQVFSQFRKVCHERLYQALPGVRPRPQPQPPHALASDPLPDAPRQCLDAALVANRGEFSGGQQGAATWINELLWREFYKHILVGYPRVSRHRPFREETEALRWRQAPAELEAWQQGRTGITIIDAAMRQLLATGWMHNRLRMVVAMFLSKNLLIDWREGERWFMRHLIDGDLAANNGGWQWSASTGTDAVPYFRLFNPLSQSERFDPRGEFIRHWLPELAGLERKAIHDPSSLGLFAGVDYPRPMVDLKASRERALAAFRNLPPRDGRA